MAIYEATAKDLLESCQRYRIGQMSLPTLKAKIWETAEAIVAHEEAETRSFLQRAEGQLDMLEHTKEEVEIFDASLGVVGEVEERVRLYLAR